MDTSKVLLVVWAVSATYAAARLRGLLVDAERDANHALSIAKSAVVELADRAAECAPQSEDT